MNIGQKVLLIATWPENHGIVPPPIGSVGEIADPMDDDGDYYVTFPDWRCWDGTYEWFTPHWALVPIDEGQPLVMRTQTVTV